MKIVAASAAERPATARYVAQGSLRRAGSMLRVTVELIDSESRVHLWGEKYDREFTPAQLFAVQDDVAARVIANIGDSNGVLISAMVASLRERGFSELTLDELIVQSFRVRVPGGPGGECRTARVARAGARVESGPCGGLGLSRRDVSVRATAPRNERP